MKKIISLAFAAMMAFSAVCLAAGDGAVLNKLQKPAEAMIGMFDGKTEYAAVVKSFTAEAAANFKQETFDSVKKQAKEKFGDLKESKFVAFQRLDQVDIVAYLGAFTKEKIVNLSFIFDKTGKIVNFQFSPIQAQQQQPAKK